MDKTVAALPDTALELMWASVLALALALALHPDKTRNRQSQWPRRNRGPHLGKET